MRKLLILMVLISSAAHSAEDSLATHSRKVCEALDLAYASTVAIDSAFVVDVASTPEMKQKFLEYVNLMYRGRATISASVRAMALSLYARSLAGAPQKLELNLQSLKQLGADTEENRKQARQNAFAGEFRADCMYELGRLEGQGKLREFLSLPQAD